MNELLLAEKMQRTGLAAIIMGVLRQDVNEPEAVALQMATVDTLMMVMEQHPIGDMIDKNLVEGCLAFAERGIAKEELLDQVKGILNEEGGE